MTPFSLMAFNRIEVLLFAISPLSFLPETALYTAACFGIAKKLFMKISEK